MTDSSDQQQQLDQLNLEISQESSSATDDKAWTDQGINENIVQKIRSYIENGNRNLICNHSLLLLFLGKLNSSDIDSRVCEQLRSFPYDASSIDSLFNEFDNSDLTGVVNKGAFLCNLIKQWKIQHPEEQKSSNNNSQSTQDDDDHAQGSSSGKHKPGPDETRLQVNIFIIIDSTKNSINLFHSKFLIELGIKWISLLVKENMAVHHRMVLKNQPQAVKYVIQIEIYFFQF